MPRPRVGRTRSNRGAPQRPQRVSKSVPTVTRDEVLRQLANKPAGHVPANSDDSDELVVRTPGKRNRRGIAKREIFGSGALGKGDVPLAHKEYQIAKAKADLRKYSQTPPASDAQKQMQRTDRATSSTSSLTSISASSTPKSILKRSASDGAQPASVARPNGIHATAQPTPGTASKASFADLKPRKRQPSLLAGLKDDTSLQNTDLDLDGADLDEFDDIVPNDESTPFTSTRINGHGPASSPSAQPVSSINGRKRKITSLQVEDESQVGSSKKRLSNGSSQISRISETPDLNGSPSLPATRSNLPEDDDDEVNAPPQSSSPTQSPVASPKQSKVAKITEDESRPTRRKAKPKQPSMSTEALQALLPSRRQFKETKGKSEFDIPSDSSQNVEENETSHLPAKKLRKAKTGKDESRGIVKETAAGSKGKRGGKASKSTPTAPEETSGRRTTRKVLTQKGPNPPASRSPLKDVVLSPSSLNSPLSSFKNRPAAKISSQQVEDNNSNITKPNGNKISYSSRRLQPGTLGGEEDKENQHSIMSKRSSTRTSTEGLGSDHVSSEKMGDVIEVGGKVGKKKKKVDKWAMIDAFDLDFEDASFSEEGLV